MKVYVTLCVATLGTGIIFLWFMNAMESPMITMRYDCRQLIGGWHPDVPVKVQQMCKKKGYDADSKTSD